MPASSPTPPPAAEPGAPRTAAGGSSSASAGKRKRDGEDGDRDDHRDHSARVGKVGGGRGGDAAHRRGAGGDDVAGDGGDVDVDGRGHGFVDDDGHGGGDGVPTNGMEAGTEAAVATVGDMVKVFTDRHLPPSLSRQDSGTGAPSSSPGAAPRVPNQSSDHEHGSSVAVVHPFSRWREPLISSTSVIPPECVVDSANANANANANGGAKNRGDAPSSSNTGAAASAPAPAPRPASTHAVPTMEDFNLAHRNDLTLFEVHRGRREVLIPPPDGEAKVGVPLRVLNAEFCCPVCLGYMKRTSIVMECLHRFCGECIQKCLRLGVKKECPSCRIHIPSRRSLRPDPNFDMLIAGIYGDIRALEDREEREIEVLNKARNMNNAYAESRRRGILQQAMYRKRKGQVRSSDSEAAAGSKRRASSQSAMESPLVTRPTSTTPPLEQVEECSPLVDFVLRRHPQETFVDRLDKEYMRTNRRVTVQLLKTFLSRKLSYEPLTDFKILIVVDGDAIILDDAITLDDVERSLSEQPGGFGEHLIFHYAVHNTIGEDS